MSSDNTLGRFKVILCLVWCRVINPGSVLARTFLKLEEKINALFQLIWGYMVYLLVSCNAWRVISSPHPPLMMGYRMLSCIWICSGIYQRTPKVSGLSMVTAGCQAAVPGQTPVPRALHADICQFSASYSHSYATMRP